MVPYLDGELFGINVNEEEITGQDIKISGL
jgi:hypothetical protein